MEGRRPGPSPAGGEMPKADEGCWRETNPWDEGELYFKTILGRAHKQLPARSPATFSVHCHCPQSQQKVTKPLEERLGNGIRFKRYGFIFAEGFGLRSASGESGAEDGEERLANRSRSATPAAEPQTEARRSCGNLLMSARDERSFCDANRRGRRENGATGKPVRRSKNWVGHGEDRAKLQWRHLVAFTAENCLNVEIIHIGVRKSSRSL
jgi:hypothetical protein